MLTMMITYATQPSSTSPLLHSPISCLFQPKPVKVFSSFPCYHKFHYKSYSLTSYNGLTMIMMRMNIIVTFILLSWPTNLGISVSHNGKRYVEDACSVAHYRDLCIHSLAPFSNTAKRNPCKWARAGVSVTISEAKRVAQYLIRVKKQGHMRGKNRLALSDCIECIQDSLDNLHRSLDVLRKLSGRTFDAQMSDVTTWMSASLTDEETCLDGFEGQKGNQVRILRSQVQNATYITSNALALVAKLASTGAGSINSP